MSVVLNREARLRKVLIVDDEPSVRFVLGKTCERAGVPYDEAGSAEEAREKLRAHGGGKNGIGLVLLDVRLPGDDGFKLLGEIGGHRYGNFVENPRIVTASSTSEWLAYVGLRPGIAFRITQGSPSVLIGIWGFARWDLQNKDVPVTVAGVDNTAPGRIELGGTTIGAVARLGLDF